MKKTPERLSRRPLSAPLKCSVTENCNTNLSCINHFDKMKEQAKSNLLQILVTPDLSGQCVRSHLCTWQEQPTRENLLKIPQTNRPFSYSKLIQKQELLHVSDTKLKNPCPLKMTMSHQSTQEGTTLVIILATQSKGLHYSFMLSRISLTSISKWKCLGISLLVSLAFQKRKCFNKFDSMN